MSNKGKVYKNISWYFITDVSTKDGRRKQVRKGGFKTKKEAQQAMLELQYQYSQQNYLEPTKMTYKEYLEEWFETKKMEIGFQTAENYKHNLRKHIVPGLGSFPLNKLSPIHIQAFINSLVEHLNPATIKKIVNIIKNSLNHAVDMEVIPKNVATKVKTPKLTKNTLAVWDQVQINQFLMVAKNNPNYIVFLLAISTGMRQGELLGLRWKDVDLNNGHLTITQTLARDGKTFLKGAKTKSSLRQIKLPEKIIAALKLHKQGRNKLKLKYGAIYQNHDLVLSCDHGAPLDPSNVRRTFNSLIKEADVPKIRFHDLRHTCATLLLSNGINVKVVSELLGHSSSIITLDTYSHVLPSMQKEVAEKLNSLIL